MNITRTHIVRPASNACAARNAERCPKSLPIRLLFAPSPTVIRVGDERHGGDPGGRDWRGRYADRSPPRARHPPQPEGETHLFFACIIRWPDRRGSTPARDRSKLNRRRQPPPQPSPVNKGVGEPRSGWEGAGIDASTSGDRTIRRASGAAPTRYAVAVSASASSPLPLASTALARSKSPARSSGSWRGSRRGRCEPVPDIAVTIKICRRN